MTLTHIAFGGIVTALPSDEVARVVIESAVVDAEGFYVLTGRLPADDGGFSVGHIGVIDSDGDLIAAGACPEFYKPLLEENGDFEYIVRIRLAVQATECFTVSYDTSAFATVGYVDQVTEEINNDFTAQRNETQTLIDQTNILVTQATTIVGSTSGDAAAAAASAAAAAASEQNAATSEQNAATSEQNAASSAGTASSAAATAVAARDAAYRDSDYGVFLPQPPGAEDIIAAWPVQYPAQVPVDWAGSIAKLLTPAAAGLALTIYADAGVLGTITFGAASTDGVFSAIAATPVAAGSVLSIQTGATVPLDCADLTLVVRVERTA